MCGSRSSRARGAEHERIGDEHGVERAASIDQPFQLARRMQPACHWNAAIHATAPPPARHDASGATRQRRIARDVERHGRADRRQMARRRGRRAADERRLGDEQRRRRRRPRATPPCRGARRPPSRRARRPTRRRRRRSAVRPHDCRRPGVHVSTTSRRRGDTGDVQLAGVDARATRRWSPSVSTASAPNSGHGGSDHARLRASRQQEQVPDQAEVEAVAESRRQRGGARRPPAARCAHA